MPRRAAGEAALLEQQHVALAEPREVVGGNDRGIGARASGHTAQYVALLFLVDGLPYFALVMWQRRAAHAVAMDYIRRRWPVALVGSCASLGSYGIALWAMTQAPIASVAALRETSVLFAALIGLLLLKERFRLQRAAGTVAIVAGVMALRFG